MPPKRKYKGLGMGTGDRQMVQKPSSGSMKSLDANDLKRMKVGKLSTSDASKSATDSKVKRRGGK